VSVFYSLCLIFFPLLHFPDFFVVFSLNFHCLNVCQLPRIMAGSL
jgi:hypothetical protein